MTTASTQPQGRLAGLLWFLTVITGGFGMFYIRSRILVLGDAPATAAHIMASEFLFRTANKADPTFLGDLIQTGRITPVIDRRYKLSEPPEALRYLNEGHARGKVVITVE